MSYFHSIPTTDLLIIDWWVRTSGIATRGGPLMERAMEVGHL